MAISFAQVHFLKKFTQPRDPYLWLNMTKAVHWRLMVSRNQTHPYLPTENSQTSKVILLEQL